MNTLSHFGVGVFQWVLQTTWQAAVLTGLILLAQWLLHKRLSPGWRCGLWLLLIARLLMPVPPQSAFSIFNLTKSAPTHPVEDANRLLLLYLEYQAVLITQMSWISMFQYPQMTLARRPF